MNSKELLNKYNKLNIKSEYIGLDKGRENGDYFCTPLGTKVIAWDNGIHYGFIEGLGETFFLY